METDGAQEAQPQFEAVVAIGKGLRFIDRKGLALISGGRLSLRKAKGDVIVEAPVSDVHAETFRFSAGGAVKISIAGERYTIEPVKLRRIQPTFIPGVGEGAQVGSAAAGNLAGDLSRLVQGRELTKAFLAALEAAGGQIGSD